MTSRTAVVRSACVAAAALMLTACAQPTTSDPGSQLEDVDAVTLTVSTPLPANSSLGIAMAAFMDRVREESGGKIDFELFDSSTLHGNEEALSALESGLTDITNLNPSFFPDDLPAYTWVQNFGVLATGETPQDILAGTPAGQVVFSTTDATSQELAGHNAVALSVLSTEGYTLACNEPVTTLEQAKGKLVRTVGGAWDQEAEALGMTTVLLDNKEVYEGLQRGVIDCAIGAPATHLAFGLAEVAKYYMPLQFTANTGSTIAMNKETLDGLPADAQQILREAAALVPVVNARELEAQSVEWLETAAEEGVELVEVENDLSEALEDLQTARGEELPSTAPASVSHPDTAVEAYRGAFDEWKQILAEEFGLEPNDGSAAAIEEDLRFLSTDFDWEAYTARFIEFLNDSGD
ncbi:TRAP transporter substrate-binding protein DctP [Nocardioides sp. NPDC051685]|uniref:TRAP transporter substrate-binding protein DctP n=1 Tax=Nocardioides sp. NPDC051685 TaxID=3364334 RepID=UPI0037B0FEF9